jgi:hypothetical protein
MTLSSNYSRTIGDIAGCFLLYRLAKQLAYVFSLEYSEIQTSVENAGFEIAKLIPSIQKQLADEKANVEKTLEIDLKTKTRAMGKSLLALPKTGESAESILAIMKSALVSEDEIWENGKVSGCVYHGDRNHQQLLNTAYSLYSLSVSASIHRTHKWIYTHILHHTHICHSMIHIFSLNQSQLLHPLRTPYIPIYGHLPLNSSPRSSPCAPL